MAPPAKKTPAKKAPATKSPAKKPPAKGPATSPAKKAAAQSPAAKKPPAKSPAAKPAARRDDFGAGPEAFFAKQPVALRPLVDALRAHVDEAAPSARVSLKWGMPVYELDGAMLCAIGAHKAHVNLILSGPAGTFSDPAGLLVGDGKTGRHLKLTPGSVLPDADVRRWLGEAVTHARTAPR